MTLQDNALAANLKLLVDQSTFVFPEPLISTTITIEFCDRVRNILQIISRQ